MLLASQINFILHYNDKIICQRNKIPVSSRITFQGTYANLFTHFHRIPNATKFFFFQILTKILFLIKRGTFSVQITATNEEFFNDLSVDIFSYFNILYQNFSNNQITKIATYTTNFAAFTSSSNSHA